MYLYLQNTITKEIVASSEQVQALWGNELHFNNQKSARYVANALSDSILFELPTANAKQITYAADLAEGIVIPQKFLSIILSESQIGELLHKYMEYELKIEKWKTNKE